MQNIVHIVGTGTIGEPLIGLFTDFREKLGFDEVTVHKRTPLSSDRSKLAHLMSRGAKLAADVFARTYHEVFGLPTVVLRMCNLFGPSDFNIGYRLIPRAMHSLYGGPQPTAPTPLK